jgi:DNA-binding NtrC family response regulator
MVCYLDRKVATIVFHSQVVGGKLCGKQKGNTMESFYGETVLLIEDEPLIALELHAIVSEVGASVLAALDCKEAKQMIATCDISVAILDVNLNNNDCSDLVANYLRARKIPFMFYTGYQTHDVMSRWPDIPVLQKPSTRLAILEGMSKLLLSKKVHTNRTQQQQV